MNLIQDLKNFPNKFKNKPLIVPAAQDKLNIMIGLCCHRNLDPETSKMIDLTQQCPDVNVFKFVVTGDSLISRARSLVAYKFLTYKAKEKNMDILFFIDDDIIFNPREIPKMAKLMVENKLDICGAGYVLKNQNNTHFAIKTLDNSRIPFGENGVIAEIRCLSTGFMAIQRHVFEKMIEKEIAHLCHAEDGLAHYPFFNPYEKQIDGRWINLSEDWAFTERARELGFKVWIDTTIKLGHAGRYVYTWDDMLKEPMKDHKNFEYFEDKGGACVKIL